MAQLLADTQRAIAINAGYTAELLSQVLPNSSPSPAASPNTRRQRDLATADIVGSMTARMEILAEEIVVYKSPIGFDIPHLEMGIQHMGSLAKRCSVLQGELDIAHKQKGYKRNRSTIEMTLANLKTACASLESYQVGWKAALEACRRRTNPTAIFVDVASHYAPILPLAAPVIQLVLYMVVVCSTVLLFHRRGSTWLLEMSHVIVQTSLEQIGLPLSAHNLAMLQQFPRDVPTIVSKFNLDTKSVTYAVCPKCHHIYPPVVSPETGLIQYPERCNFQRYNRGKICKEILTRPPTRGKGERVPIKPFVSFDFNDWLAGLLSREGNEKKMDAAWNGILEPAPAVMSDIFHGTLLRNFQGPGPNSQHFSVASDKSEGRYVFSVGFDFFNPLTNKQAGKKISVGCLAVICLNLPVSERYKPENMFLAGIIPGPREPPLDTVNSFWIPLVDCFLNLWHHGVKLSRTHDYEFGRVIRCAIVAVICDLPAARKLGGFASYSHRRFCTRCLCTRKLKGKGETIKRGKSQQDGEDQVDQERAEAEKLAEEEEENIGIEDSEIPGTDPTKLSPPDEFEGGVHYGEEVGYNDFNTDKWQPRTASQTRLWMEKYKTARNAAEAQRHFNLTGLRWTEFLRLPYFDVSRMIVVDCMHNLFLGLLREHFRTILGFRAQAGIATPRAVIKIAIPEHPNNPRPVKKNGTEDDSVKRALKLLQKAMTEENAEAVKVSLSKCSKPALCYVAQGISCPGFHASQYKARISQLLVEWRKKQIENEDPPPSAVLGQVMNRSDMEALWEDIANTIKPSWMTSVPAQVGGSAGGGKLKADEWRVLGTLYMPVTLVRLWSNSDPSSEQHQILDLTMELVSAIILAASRESSASIADAYQQHMLRYRAGVQKLFPEYQCHPNHHMALHIAECLRLFGPVHGWWTFPFERLIGTLERIPTNYKAGQYEATISRSYHRIANLRLLQKKTVCPNLLKECQPQFLKLIAGQIRNVFIADEVIPSTIVAGSGRKLAVPADIIKAFKDDPAVAASLPSHVRFLSHLMIGGFRYSVHSKHPGNSCAMICDSSSKQALSPVIIRDIIQDSESPKRVYLVARRYRRLPSDITDPYLQYPILRASMWKSDLSNHLCILKPAEVQMHFAKCEIMWQKRRVNVVLSLGKNLMESISPAPDDNDSEMHVDEGDPIM